MQDGENGESYRGMLVSKVRETAREVCRTEMKNCTQGALNKQSIENLKAEVTEVKTDFATGISEIKTLLQEKHDDKKSNMSNIITIAIGVLTVIVMLYIAFKPTPYYYPSAQATHPRGE